MEPQSKSKMPARDFTSLKFLYLLAGSRQRYVCLRSESSPVWLKRAGA